jgi:hypothetical protein
MDYNNIRTKAVEWMIARDWKRRTAKRGGFNQSLFEHTIYELDALITLWPILSESWGLSEQDLAGLIVGTVAHDVGKETPEWQQYVLADRGTVPYTPHVVEDLTQAAVDTLFAALGLFGSLDDAKAFVRYHMQATKTTDSLIFDAINKGDKNNRWMTLSTIVAEVDNICSAKGLLDGVKSLERTSIGKHIMVSYHLVQVRGVSTTLLHRAAMEAFQDKGWSPLLHYSNGTMYVLKSSNIVSEPVREDIESQLAKLVEDAMGRDFASSVVTTDFRASAIAIPQLFDYREIKEYLSVAGMRVRGGENRFEKKLQSSGGRSQVEKMVRAYLRLPKDEVLDEFRLARESQRISRAYPEMCIFKFFKAAMDLDLIGGTITDEAQAYYQTLLPPTQSSTKKTARVTPQIVAQVEYDRVFGEGAFFALLGASTLMPARDMALCIDYYWSRPGEQFGLEPNLVEHAPDDIRRAALVNTLARIAGLVYDALPPENQPTRAASSDIAREFIGDLMHPSSKCDWHAITQEQLTIYGASKQAAKSPRGDHFCPICNVQFGAGPVAKAAFLDKPESHTNRAISHGSSSPGYIVICPTCKYERFIRNLLLGGKPAELLVLVPRMNIGQGSGAELVQKARELSNGAMLLMSNDTTDPYQRVSLSLTQMIARKLSDQDVFTPSPQALLDLFTYSAAKDKRKEYRKALEDRLREEFGSEVEDLNTSWDTEFADWDAAIKALIDGTVMDSTALSIRSDAYKLQPSLRVVCQTPNLILLPLLQPMSAGKDSEVNAAIRRLFTMLVLGLALDCTVAVLNSGDAITFEGGEGIVRVPRVPALRDLVGCDWIQLDQAEKWLKAIGAASLIAQATGLPESSNLYQILSAPTPGHILRRIEQHSESGQASFSYLQHLETLKEVLR